MLGLVAHIPHYLAQLDYPKAAAVLLEQVELAGRLTIDLTELHECRSCCSFCDRVVHPAGCIATNCQFLYLYDDEQTGRRFMGCMNKVFRGEIDVELFEQAEHTRQGFGGVKMSGLPLPQCRSSVERAYDGYSEAFQCKNPQFFTKPSLEDIDAAFDLRDEL